MEIISRQEALRIGLKRYFTGIPCVNGHISQRYASRQYCCGCEEDSRQRRAEYRKQYRARPENREKRRLYQLHRRKTDVNYRITLVIRMRIYDALKGLTGGRSAVRDLGMPIPAFREYIERQMMPGMTWENYGREWELDHIRPLASFNLSDPEKFKSACSYRNYQPLWKSDNRRKRATLPPDEPARSAGETPPV